MLGILFDLIQAIIHLADGGLKLFVLFEAFYLSNLASLIGIFMCIPVVITGIIVSVYFAENLLTHHLPPSMRPSTAFGRGFVYVPLLLLGLVLSPFYAVIDYLLHACSCCSCCSSSSSSASSSTATAIPVQEINNNNNSNNDDANGTQNYHQPVNPEVEELDPVIAQIIADSGNEQEQQQMKNSPASCTVSAAQELRDKANAQQGFLNGLRDAVNARNKSFELYIYTVPGNLLFTILLAVGIAIKDEGPTLFQALSLAISVINIAMKVFLLCRAATITATFAKCSLLLTDIVRILFLVLALFAAGAPNEVNFFGAETAQITYLFYVWVMLKLLFGVVSYLVFVARSTAGVFKSEGFWWGIILVLFIWIIGVWTIGIGVVIHEFVLALCTLFPDHFEVNQSNDDSSHLTLLHEFLWSTKCSNNIVVEVLDWKGTFLNMMLVEKMEKVSPNNNSNVFRHLRQTVPAAKLASRSDSFMSRAGHVLLFSNMISLYELIPVTHNDNGEEKEKQKNDRIFADLSKNAKDKIQAFINEYDDNLLDTSAEEEKWNFLDFFSVANMLLLQIPKENPIIILLLKDLGIIFPWIIMVYLISDKIIAQFLFPVVYAALYFSSFTLLTKVFFFCWAFCFCMSVFAFGPSFVKYYLTCQVFYSMVKTSGKAYAVAMLKNNTVVESYFWIPLEMLVGGTNRSNSTSVIPDSVIPRDPFQKHVLGFLGDSHVPISMESFEEFHSSRSVHQHHQNGAITDNNDSELDCRSSKEAHPLVVSSLSATSAEVCRTAPDVLVGGANNTRCYGTRMEEKVQSPVATTTTLPPHSIP